MRILTAIVVALVTGSMGVAQPAAPKFEVASIRRCEPAADAPGQRSGGVGVMPGRLNVTCMPAMFLIQAAYVAFATDIVKPFESVPISGGPAWLKMTAMTSRLKRRATLAPRHCRGPCFRRCWKIGSS